MFVKSWMSMDPVTVLTADTINRAMVLMRRHSIRRLPVKGEDGTLVGIISKEDVRKALPSAIDAGYDDTARALKEQARVEAFMTSKPITVFPGDPLEKAALLMRRNKIGGIPVVEGGRLLGIVTESDIFKAFIEILGNKDEGIRLELSIDREAEMFFRILDVFKGHHAEIKAISVCNDYSASKQLLTIRFSAEREDEVVDDLWSLGLQINSILKAQQF